ncbi:MAG: Na+/H+ antiporter subunit E [Pseudoalteromonas distincta]|tara:strand:- start:37100 stop:37609 length:510 start_codon:yes stop_codon:yes gene_type:complete
MTTRWLPSPVLSLLLLVTWLLISQSLELAHWLLGIVLGVAIPYLMRRLQPRAGARMRNPLLLLRLLSMALVEIIRSCLNLARIILFARSDGLRSEFIRVPLDLRDPYGLAVLSCLINSTPGTVWVEITEDDHHLILHVFDLQDEQWWVDTIKRRYERPLIEIFEGGRQP